MDAFIKVEDGEVRDGLDFVFWADECAATLGIMEETPREVTLAKKAKKP